MIFADLEFHDSEIYNTNRFLQSYIGKMTLHNCVIRDNAQWGDVFVLTGTEVDISDLETYDINERGTNAAIFSLEQDSWGTITNWYHYDCI